MTDEGGEAGRRRPSEGTSSAGKSGADKSGAGNGKDGSAPARRKARGSFHHGDLADALVVAGTEMIAERASADFSLREVAGAVGVSHTAAYRHFSSKTELMAEIALRGFRALQAHLEDSADRLSDPDADLHELLLQVGRTYIAFAVDNAGTYRILFRPDVCNRAPFPALANAADEAFLALVAVIEKARGGGIITRDIADEMLASTFWASLHGYASLLLDRQISEGADVYAPPAERETFLILIVNALTAQ